MSKSVSQLLLTLFLLYNQNQVFGQKAPELVRFAEDLALISYLKMVSSEHQEQSFQAASRHIDEITRLIDSGCGTEVIDQEGKTALMHAAAISSEAILKLIEAGALIDQKDPKGRTALFFAVEKGNLDAVKALVEEGSSIEIHDDYGFGLLVWAAKHGDVSIIKYLYEQGLAVNEPAGYRHQTPLMAAAEAGHLNAVQYLVGRGARVDYANQTGQSALMGATNAAVIRFLLDHGAQIHRRNNKGLTPLIFAVMNGRPEAVATLIELGADLGDTGEFDEPILNLAMRYQRSEICRILIDAGAPLDAPVSGFPLFVAAARYGLLDLLKYLVSLGLQPSDYPEALLQAALKGQVETMCWLLEMGVPIEFKDARYDQTALYVAVSANKADAVRLLLDAGADAQVTDRNGETALERAKRLNYVQIVSLLEAKGSEL